jgi:NTE family protein
LVAAQLAIGLDQAEHADRIAQSGVPEPPAGLLERAATALPRLLALQAQAAELGVRERARRVGRFALEAETIPEDSHVAAVTSRLPEGDWPASLRLMAVDAETGELVRLSADLQVGVGRGVAAARAVPGVLPTVTIAGRRLMDAVVASGTNADVAAADGIHQALVITAAASQAKTGTLDAALEAGLRRELDALEAAGVAVEVIRADEEARSAMGEQLYGTGDATVAVNAGRRAGRAAARRAGV